LVPGRDRVVRVELGCHNSIAAITTGDGLHCLGVVVVVGRARVPLRRVPFGGARRAGRLASGVVLGARGVRGWLPLVARAGRR
jgi:hypothetical protein